MHANHCTHSILFMTGPELYSIYLAHCSLLCSFEMMNPLFQATGTIFGFPGAKVGYFILFFLSSVLSIDK